MLFPLFGFGIYHLISENPYLGTLLLASAIPLLLSIISLWQGQDNTLFIRSFVLMASITVVAICYFLGIRGLLYVFVVTSMLLFIFGFQHGLKLSLLFTIVSLLAALHTTPLAMIVRFAIALLLSLTFTACFAYLVELKTAALEKQANHDPLTGAMNRRAMTPALQEAIDLNQRYHRHFSLICVDLDHFKQINDNHGHITGDQVLKTVSQTMQRSLRKTDRLFRFGGEEFAILLPETEQMDAMSVAEKLRNRISTIDFGSKIQLTASFGVAELVCDEDSDSWLKRCDAHLYQAKASGRNKVVSI